MLKVWFLAFVLACAVPSMAMAEQFNVDICMKLADGKFAIDRYSFTNGTDKDVPLCEADRVKKLGSYIYLVVSRIRMENLSGDFSANGGCFFSYKIITDKEIPRNTQSIGDEDGRLARIGQIMKDRDFEVQGLYATIGCDRNNDDRQCDKQLDIVAESGSMVCNILAHESYLGGYAAGYNFVPMAAGPRPGTVTKYQLQYWAHPNSNVGLGARITLSGVGFTAVSQSTTDPEMKELGCDPARHVANSVGNANRIAPPPLAPGGGFTIWTFP